MMSIVQTRTFFSMKVSSFMDKLGYHREAYWCRLCYNFLIACDDRHIEAATRMAHLLDMYKELERFTPSPKFPPLGASSLSSVTGGCLEFKGIPMELCEATMAACQTRLMLYGVCPNGYSARAVSSIDVENCHGIINRQHHSGAQQATIHQIQRTLAHLILLTLVKRRPVFRELFDPPKGGIYPPPQVGVAMSESLQLTDCAFDLIKGSGRNKENVPDQLHMAPRGALAIRSIGQYRRNEAATTDSNSPSTSSPPPDPPTSSSSPPTSNPP